MAAVPRVPLVTIAKVSDELSTSVAISVPLAATFSVVASGPSVATGASLTGVIVTVTVATFDVVVPLLAWKVKLSVPCAFGCGV